MILIRGRDLDRQISGSSATVVNPCVGHNLSVNTSSWIYAYKK